ncbi:SPOR domain-containing protein [uncultured Desulfosarcina sp.]|uniref:SPOR domain-containing protein n=1 Tax=uncultured Desulfosarcina sp. TaxID=218289 RepID=UPI0029C6FD83|nr:SPOR domain-containing protein [uncultured Desulfosarcina sp.]
MNIEYRTSNFEIRILGLFILLFMISQPVAQAEDNPYESGLRALQAKEYDAAIEAFTLALETMPHDYEALSNRAVAWYYKQAYDRAIADATRALEINPYYSVGANQLAWMLATCPDPRYRDGKRAVALAEKVVQRFPEANFMDTLAAAYAEAGNMEAAVRVQQMAVDHLKKETVLGDKTSFENRLNVYDQAAAQSRETRDASSPTHEDTVAEAATSPSSASTTVAALVSPSSTSSKTEGEMAFTETGPAHEKDLRYTVHLFSFRKEETAREKAASLVRENQPAYICRAYIDGDPVPWFRVCVGSFPDDQAANQYAQQQKEQGQDWAKAMPLPEGAVKVGH